eukprot:TRINITY_DN5909_c0_g2_i1.p2 TRINITY_DN5909_c0_g2~~TRINITY_DN5909_c0_g2_i1.p2  ORF type:complete len:103 (-),score=1.51 TRINITY_DN5909_c0_g2_i1:163-471(-)
MIDFLAGFRSIGKVRMALRIFQVQGTRMRRNKTDNPLAHPKAGHVDGLFGQTTCRKKLKHLARPHDIDRAHLSHHISSNDGHDLAKTFLSSSRPSHDVSDAL